MTLAAQFAHWLRTQLITRPDLTDATEIVDGAGEIEITDVEGS